MHIFVLVIIIIIFFLGTLLNEGGQTLDQLFDTMCFKLGKYLQEIGLVPKSINDVVGLTRVSICFYKF